ncbi:toll/interleukin-1 receptor domain-containing protein [Spongiactinospora sp. TRM90649]|uniref:toll/interleukin-1 receptor domain-containing protein n=1 Tax=Spongiactinospora sp. TRM90649 TaxID=3031114 RepID=UPI0023F6DA82|nr:toll/interleukin-1 receptor domain-containing protein [Spongiactinospora sp. TRM90649]MDF5753152.1 toll/interleukin-1 receptor domain-containing protein [Spongiactinospora sp. TRM90649]
MSEIFINYRTGDGDKTATTIETKLADRFGREQVFRDRTSIRPGEHFPPRLLHALRSSSAVVAVIGPGWARSPLLHDEKDWVHRELAEALACQIHVVPVFDGLGIQRLKAEELPADLARLAEIQYFELGGNHTQDQLIALGNLLADLVPELKKTDRLDDRSSEPGTVANSVHDTHGTTVQGRDLSGTFHMGKGDIRQHTHDTNTTYGGSHITGPGGVHVAGDNSGGINHRFGDSAMRDKEDDVR